MIVDAFLYDGEEEVLRARLRELDEVVDAYVAVAASRTHQGDAVDVGETFSVEANIWHVDRRPRVHQHVADLSHYDDLGRGGVGTPDYQVRERAHRDSIIDAVHEYVDDAAGALVLVSDVDEIPRAIDVQRVDRLLLPGHIMVFEQRMHALALDWLHPQCWLGTQAIRLHDAPTAQVQWGQWMPQEMRDARGQQDRCPQYPQGGWHLSWMNGPKQCERKVHRFSHAEYAARTADDFAELIKRGVDINGTPMRRINVEDYDWPEGLLDRAKSWRC